jgi:hypothetical protein
MHLLAAPGGHVIAVFADNTSALLWLHYASCLHCHHVLCLAHFTSALAFVCFGFSGQSAGLTSLGHLNCGADALSCCLTSPTWASVME